MNFPDRKTVERVRKEFPAGCRVVLDRMEDVHAREPGTQGTCLGVDDTASVLVSWDGGGDLNVVYGEDICHRIHTEEEALTTIQWYGKRQPEEDARCPRCGELMPGSKNRHALSRYADIMVCDQCGMVEALEKAGIIEARPLMKWCCIEVPQNGGGEWKR
jgi:hypothetical protein